MRLAEKLAEKAFEAMKNDGVIISAADFQNNIIGKMQLYFLDDEDTVASDIIKRNELLEAGVEDIFVLNVNASSERELIRRIGVCEINDALYLKFDPEDTAENDNFGVELPSVAYMESFELLSIKK